MTETIYFRLLESEDKEATLNQAIQQLIYEQPNPNTFAVEPESFKKVPGAPFAYWVGDGIRQCFYDWNSIAEEGVKVKQGLATAADPRFLRVFWEVPLSLITAEYLCFAKGGAFSRFYSDIFLRIRWDSAQLEIGSNLNEKGGIKSNIWMLKDTVDTFFQRTGLTYPLRTNGFSVRVLPQKCIFGHKGPSVFVKDDNYNNLLAICSVMNSRLFNTLVAIQLARTELAQSYEVGIIKQTPIPDLTPESETNLAMFANCSWSLKRSLDTITQTSHAFILPALLQFKGESLTDRAQAWANHVAEIETKLTQIQSEIDTVVFDLYGIDERDRLTIGNAPVNSEENESEDDDEDNDAISDPLSLTQEMIAYALGVAIGRFDVRLATGERPHPPEPEPFDPLPICSPGMLVGESGLPPISADELPVGYPIQIPFNGIIVDDEGHPNDIINRVRDVLKVIWGDRDGDIEQEACEILKVSSLREYFRKPVLFFNTHLSRYSKSRRQAPIYLPLSTRSGSYTIWLYYHRLTDQTLYTCINDYIEPKLLRTRDLSSQLRNQSDRTSSESKQLETLQDLEAELTDLRDELLRVAQLPFKPNLNDGVQITVAPLWQLFRLPKWQKKLKETWDKLEQGEYDWVHLAYSIWPERVRAKCKTDKSLAIAHDLESLYEPPPEKPKSSSKKKRKTAE